MATEQDHETTELAKRLTSAADGIVHAAAFGLERDLRSAAALLEEVERPMPLISKLMSELSKIANACPDAATARRVRQLLGEL